MNTDSFKRMCRLLDYTRRSYINIEWSKICEGTPAAHLSSRHIYYLTLIRAQLPCNLNTVMQLTGLSSSAASTFVEKMVKSGIVFREPNHQDRRNVQIKAAPETQSIFDEMDRRLDLLIDTLTRDFTPDEIEAIETTGELVYRKLMPIRNQILAQASASEDAATSTFENIKAGKPTEYSTVPSLKKPDGTPKSPEKTGVENTGLENAISGKPETRDEKKISE